MYEVTLKNMRPEDLAKLKDLFPDSESRQSREWSFPAGESMVTLSVSGPSHRRESEVLQYAIDVLELAKKHATD